MPDLYLLRHIPLRLIAGNPDLRLQTMKITFRLDYYLNRNESMEIIGSLPVLASGLVMSEGTDGAPTLTIDPGQLPEKFSYRYRVRRGDGSLRDEWGPDRIAGNFGNLSELRINDQWRDCPTYLPFLSSAFTESIFRRNAASGDRPALRGGMLEINVDAPMIPSDMTIAISGNCAALGNWNPAQAIELSDAELPVWSTQIARHALPNDFEFKFILIRKSDHTLVGWENGNNRRFSLPELSAEASMRVNGLFMENPLQLWRGSGTAIPVFSLRSDEGFGTGEFSDLRKLADWAAMTGQQFIQLLPINDTTMSRSWTDSYPYTTNSTFALHPMYLRLEEVGILDDPEKRRRFDELRKELNALPTVDYERVNRAKEEYLHLIFDQQGDRDISSGKFKEFYSRNREWLKPYAVWSMLRDRFSTADMNAWGEFSVYDEKRVDRLIEENLRDFNYVCFVQYHLDRQLRAARDYADSRGIALKGDIPIGISRCSVDAWLNPGLFNLGSTAGAPPDDFAVQGQNWGFPTYRWDVMSRDGYAWWKSRLGKMAEYFSAYRIDHLLGFFRIWQIPSHTFHGLLGVFSPALPLSPEEMKESFGFEFDRASMTTPYVTDETFEDLPGELAGKVRREYFSETANGRLILQKSVATQKQIADLIPDQGEENILIRNFLTDCLDDVLFIEDPYEKGRFHPRISADRTDSFKALPPQQQNAFRALYEDFYYHRHNDFWKEKALEKLPALVSSTGMLSCAEDLGMIPACVPDVMESLRILSLEIQRMPKEAWSQIGNPSRYPYHSVCSTSTHDMAGLRQWWEEDRERAACLYHDLTGTNDGLPSEATPEICEMIIRQHMVSPSMLCILPLQDWLAIDGNLRRKDPREEQINIPANPRHYWRYRMHLTLDTLLSAFEFNSRVRALTALRS